MFASETGFYPSEAPFRYSSLWLVHSHTYKHYIRHAKEKKNITCYIGHLQVTEEKSFENLAPGTAFTTLHFLFNSRIGPNKLKHKATLSLKGLQVTNTLAYSAHLQVTE